MWLENIDKYYKQYSTNSKYTYLVDGPTSIKLMSWFPGACI